MRKIILLFTLFFLLSVTTVYADGNGDVVDVYSNPDEMIILKSAPKAFMYTQPYHGYLDAREFTLTSKSVTNVNFAHDNDASTSARINKLGEIVYELKEEKNIESFYVHGKSENIFEVEFYDAKGRSIKIVQALEIREKSFVEVVKKVDVLNVKKIVLRSGAYWVSDIREFDINLSEVYLPVFKISSAATEKSIKINWELPNHKKLVDVKVNGKSVGKVKEYTAQKLESNKEYEYNITAVYSDGTEINTVYKTRTLVDKTPPGEIKNLKIKQNGEDVELSYELPTDDDFEYVVIKRNGWTIANGYKDATYLDKDLNYNQEYTYEIITYDKNRNGSKPVTGKITLVTQEVTNLKANAKYDEVELTWNLPNADGFKKAVIYRKNNDVSMFARMFKSNETALFETNGTQFKDLTVDADTSYTYRVASVYEEETKGTTVSVKTPKVIASGGGTNKDDNGDYVITWTKPTDGKIKVMVGGKEYAIVPASDKKIIIPKDKMKFDIIGNPDVLLIPIDDGGSEGIPSKPGAGEGTGNGGGIGDIVGGSGLAEMLSPGNILKGGMGLVLLVAAILLLRMAFILVPKLIRIIRNALSRNNENTYERRRV